MKKVIGWVFIILGIMVIIWTIWNSYLIFTLKKPVPEILKIEAKEDIISQSSEKESVSSQSFEKEPLVFPLEEMQEKVVREMKETVAERLKEIMPLDVIIKLFNLISWSIFAGILIFAGGKISEIGIRLL